MNKTEFLKVRLTPAESENLAAQARSLGMTKTALARVLLLGAEAPKQREPVTSPEFKFDYSRLDRIEARLGRVESRLVEHLAEIEESQDASAKAFDNLLKQLTEILRVPSFREFRARLVAEGVEKRQDEDDTKFFLRMAARYHTAYGRWPDPSDSRDFGPVPAGFNLEKFRQSLGLRNY